MIGNYRKMFKFMHGLRGKLILTYTLVTVFALLALEFLLILAGFIINNLTQNDRTQYVQDVVQVLYTRASQFLQPGKEDPAGLQEWTDRLKNSGYASLAPQGLFDSPAAKIVESSTVYILSPDKKIIAQSPLPADNLIGKTYIPQNKEYGNKIINNAIKGKMSAKDLWIIQPDRNYLVAVPVFQDNTSSAVVGVIVVSIHSMPPMTWTNTLEIAGTLMGTGIILIILLVPFGTLFGFIMSLGITRRLSNLARVADSWSVGDFSSMPVDRSHDEIGTLSIRMRNMAEKIQSLMQDQQDLAQIKERNRIAQELHDTVKQQTFATLMQVRAARNTLASDPQAAEKSLIDAENLIKSSQQELGLMISELRPSILNGKGLIDALKNYLTGWSANSCIPSSFLPSDETPLSVEVQNTLYRVAQEALSNVARHSRATAVTVRLDYSEHGARLEIADNGVGFDPANKPSGSFGLVSMRERLAAVAGSLSVASSPGHGCIVTAQVPISE
jgi:two-component system, NarL family, sensor histidine kinase LiaS